MNRRLLLLPLLLLPACVRYAPQPLDLEAAPASYRTRSLEDPGLRAALDSMGAGGAGEWDAWRLAHAAWVVNPARHRLAAERRAAEARVVRAGGRIPSGVEGDIERSFSGRDGSSPWALALSGLFRFELGGKRDARIARAEAGVHVERAREAEAYLAALHEIRRLHAVWVGAAERLESLEREGEAVARVVAGHEARFEAGVIGASELARIRAQRDAIEADLVLARRKARDAETRLVEGTALPVRGVVRAGASPDCAAFDAAVLDSLARRALTHRPELARVLAEYQEAEGDVRVAAAASWPDLELGPGLFYDHGVGKWTIGFGVPSLPLSYRGRLGEAEALREVVAARVAEAQLSVLSEVQGALERCLTARAEGQELAGLRELALERAALAEGAYQRGEAERVVVDQAGLEVRRWDTRVADARIRETDARLALDRAIGVWEREGER